MENTLVSVAEFEIEEHVAQTNRFFKKTGFTLDDMDVYAEPFARVLRAVYRLSEGTGTEQDAFTAVQEAVKELKAIHAGIELANAGY